MSVLGYDYGNTSLLISQASKGGIDVILNDASNRQTSTCVSILGKQRFLGDAALIMSRSNITNTILLMKLLVGRQYDDADVQKEITRNSYKCCKLLSGGVGIIIKYNNDDIIISAEHAMAMMLVKAKEISNNANISNINNNIIPVSDVVIAVPNHYTDSQRRGILDACKIASINCLKVANETSAIALSYGIFKAAKKIFSDSIPTAVMFIDIGYTCYTVSIVEFVAKRMRLLSTVSDRSFGGRDFDDIIVQFLIEEFQKKTKHDIRGNTKAILKLQAAAEKAKKTLSPDGVSEANVSVECVYEDIDLSVILSRDEFERRSIPLINKLKAPIMQCFEDANMNFTNTLDIEIVGGSSRINIVKRFISDIFNLDKKAMNYGLKTTMNADEAVARGCALQCAMLSSRIKMKPFEIVERLFYGVQIKIDDKGSPIPLFKRGTAYPCKTKILTIANISQNFSISIMYDEEAVALLPNGEDRLISKHDISVKNQKQGKSNTDIRITFDIDRNGCIIFKGAHIMIPVDDTPSTTNDNTVNDDASKKFRKIEVDSKDIFKGLSQAELKQAVDMEAKMAAEDKVIIETAEKRNNLESYIYGMRDRLNGPLKNYCTEKEKNEVKSALEATEDWLYSNEGEEASKAQFIEKLNSLKKIPEKIELRVKEEENRPTNLNFINKQMDLCKMMIGSLDDDDKHTLSDTIENTEKWLKEMIKKQEQWGKDKDPILTVDMINKKREALNTIYQNFVKKEKKTKTVSQPPPPPSSSSPPMSSAESTGDNNDKDKEHENNNMEVD